ncbi:MAG: hypothetical protein HN353_01930 [Bdellovibrionales bacterium]|jgi:hypothetical protein|nr:hypothetical protein [Bdellovibrionales bacterium]MBT3525360.1 hypothetical protein [Bdellovibrionales bacterium]MBT7668120.1 hypothetical protein [Bdellovibrionales bacterium]MBT7766837.1 hypothetical protein [Bdellovibrionales bacterium]
MIMLQRRYRILLILTLLTLFTSCGVKHNPVPNVHIDYDVEGGIALEPIPDSGEDDDIAQPPTYRDTIFDILEQNCLLCHGNGSRFGNWKKYRAVAKKSEIIYQRVVVQKNMPPGGALSPLELEQFEAWYQADSPY